MKSRRITWAAVVVLAVSIAGGAWLLAQPRPGTGTFGPIAANPAYIVVNTATPVVFTAQIADPQLKKRSVVLVRLDDAGQPSDVVGRMRDDGKNGDAVAGDRIYSLRTSLNEPTVGPVNFKIAARFKPGKWVEPEADDDDWDAELTAAPNTGRDQQAERSKREKRLKKLARYRLSDPVSIQIWNRSVAIGMTTLIPSNWQALRAEDGLLIQPPAAGEGQGISVVASIESPSVTLDEWVAASFGEDLLFPGVRATFVTTASGYRVFQVVGLPDLDSGSVVSVMKVGSTVCQVVGSNTSFRLEYDAIVNTLVCGQ